MVKVKDTQSFIARARELHGDRYDYSQSVWTGSNRPIVYKCNKCGNDTQTYNARKHICQKEMQGCGKCYRRKNWSTKEDKERLRNRPCIHCGKLLNTINVKRVACSKECGFKARTLERVVVSCLVCGTDVIRTSTHVKVHKGACCSDKCQQVWAGRCGRGVNVNWELRSANARKRWVKLDSLKRRKANKWFVLISAKLTVERSQEKGWEYRIRLRLHSASGRVVKRKSLNKASGTVYAALRKIERRRSYHSLNPWEKKIGNKLSNSKHRRRRIDENKRARFQGSEDIQEARSNWVQMCFDWMGY